MTQQCRDGTGTEFSQWLRKKSELDSSLGYVATNLDYIWSNYRTGQFMTIEEKRYMKPLKPYQSRMFKKFDMFLRTDPKYRGFHFVQFEKTSPNDGEIRVDHKFMDYETFLDFLRFKLPDEMYVSYFDKQHTVACV